MVQPRSIGFGIIVFFLHQHPLEGDVHARVVPLCVNFIDETDLGFRNNPEASLVDHFPSYVLGGSSHLYLRVDERRLSVLMSHDWLGEDTHRISLFVVSEGKILISFNLILLELRQSVDGVFPQK